MEKKSFLIYLDCASAIAYLSDELAGQLFKALLEYAINGTLPEFQEPSMMGLFAMFRVQLDRDAALYVKRCQQNKSNASKRYRPKSEPQPSLAIADDGKQTHPTVIDIDKDIGIDKDNGIDSTNDVVVVYDNSFEAVYRLYDKPVGNVEHMKALWDLLTVDERATLMEYIPLYVASTPEVKYRKNFENFLFQRYWDSHPLNIESNGNKKPTADRKQVVYQRAGNVIEKLRGTAKADSGNEGHSEEIRQCQEFPLGL